MNILFSGEGHVLKDLTHSNQEHTLQHWSSSSAHMR